MYKELLQFYNFAQIDTFSMNIRSNLISYLMSPAANLGQLVTLQRRNTRP